MLHGSHRTTEWYSDLAKVLLEPKHRYIDDLDDIPLVPLEDGTWRTAPSASGPIYFPASLGTIIPSGLPLTLVKREACDCPHRMRLFNFLGVKDCDVDNIIERILDHNKMFRYANAKDIIAQVIYLFKAKAYVKPEDMRKV